MPIPGLCQKDSGGCYILICRHGESLTLYSVIEVSGSADFPGTLGVPIVMLLMSEVATYSICPG